MSAQLDFLSAPPPHQPPISRRAPSRILSEAEPLPARSGDDVRWVRALLEEWGAARDSRRRAKTYSLKPTTSATERGRPDGALPEAHGPRRACRDCLRRSLERPPMTTMQKVATILWLGVLVEVLVILCVEGVRLLREEWLVWRFDQQVRAIRLHRGRGSRV